jgi:hypothetical protein
VESDPSFRAAGNKNDPAQCRGRQDHCMVSYLEVSERGRMRDDCSCEARGSELISGD